MQMVIVGVPDPTQETSPQIALDAWKAGGMLERIAPHVTHAVWVTVPLLPASAPKDRRVVELTSQLSRTVATVASAGAFPLVIGGTRLLTSLATVSGLQQLRPGVVWLDSQDPFAPADGLDGPLDYLTGTCRDSQLASLQDAITLPDWHTLLLGIRQPTAADKRQTTLWTAQDLAEAGAYNVADDMDTWPPVYLHVDLSVLDPDVMPAVEQPIPAGLALETAAAAIEAIAANARVAGMGLTGYRPQSDPDGIGLTAALALVEAAIRIFAI